VKDNAADTIVLRTEKSRGSIPLLRLVIGGVAARRKVSVDQLDDLQLAVETLVVEERFYGGDLLLEIQAGEHGLHLRLEGLCDPEVRALLRSPAPYRPSEHRPINVRMLLDSLVDAYSLDEISDDHFAVRLEKRTS
jgi:hypothetical protein